MRKQGMRRWWIPMVPLVLLSGCIIHVGGTSAGDMAALCGDRRSASTEKRSEAEKRIHGALCQARAMDPARVFRNWDGAAVLDASLVVVLCDAKVQEGSDPSCAEGLGAGIAHDMAEAIDGAAVGRALEQAGVSDKWRKPYVDRYEQARTAALTRGSGPGADEHAQIYQRMKAELVKLAAATGPTRAGLGSLQPRLEVALAQKESSPELLAEAAAVRDALVTRCMADTKLSTGHCWHGTVARSLTEQIAKLADVTGDHLVSYLEWDTLEDEADLRAPAAQLHRALESVDQRSPWAKRAEAEAARTRDERLAGQEHLEFIGEEVLRVKTRGDRATLSWKTRVSSSTALACGKPRFVVSGSGRVRIDRPCHVSAHETTRHVNAPVELPAVDVEGVEPGHRAVVILPKGKRSGRLIEASPTFKDTGKANRWHRFRHTENRPPSDGLP